MTIASAFIHVTSVILTSCFQIWVWKQPTKHDGITAWKWKNSSGCMDTKRNRQPENCMSERSEWVMWTTLLIRRGYGFISSHWCFNRSILPLPLKEEFDLPAAIDTNDCRTLCVVQQPTILRSWSNPISDRYCRTTSNSNEVESRESLRVETFWVF